MVKNKLFNFDWYLFHTTEPDTTKTPVFNLIGKYHLKSLEISWEDNIYNGCTSYYSLSIIAIKKKNMVQTFVVFAEMSVLLFFWSNETLKNDVYLLEVSISEISDYNRDRSSGVLQLHHE